MILVVLRDLGIGDDRRSHDIANVSVEEGRLLRRLQVGLDVGPLVIARLHGLLDDQSFPEIVLQEGGFAAILRVLLAHLRSDAVVESVELSGGDDFAVENSDRLICFRRLLGRLRQQGHRDERDRGEDDSFHGASDGS